MDIYQKPIAFTSILTTGLKPLSPIFNNHPETSEDEKFYLTPYHEIYDIGLVIMSPNTLGVLGEFSAGLKICRPNIVDWNMQRVLGYDANTIDKQGLFEPEAALTQYANRVAGTLFASYATVFDLRFLESYLERYRITIDFHYHKIDLLSYTKGFLDSKRIQLASWDLNKIAEHFKIPFKLPPYRAIDRARMIAAIYKSIQLLKRENDK